MSRNNKSVDDQLEDITETMVKQVALLHLPNEFKSQLDSDDIDAISELAGVSIHELVLGILSAHAIGYLGSIDESADKPSKSVDTKPKKNRAA